MKFLLVLPLFVGTALSTFFVHKNVYEDYGKPRLLVDGLINVPPIFLKHEVPKLLTNLHSTITGVQNTNIPIDGSSRTHIEYPYHNSRFYPAHQSSGFISHAPLSTHFHIIELKDKLPVIAYHEIEPVVEEVDTSILMPISFYDINPIFKPHAGSIEAANYERDNPNTVVEHNIKEVFNEVKFPHTGAVIEEETISTMSNIGRKNSFQPNAHSKVNTAFVKKMSNRETIDARPNTRTGQITYPSEVSVNQNNFQGEKTFGSSLGSGQFNTASSSGTGGVAFQNIYLGGKGSLGRGQVFPTGGAMTQKEMKKTFFTYPNSGPIDQLVYPSSNLKGNARVSQNLPLTLGQLANGGSSIQNEITRQTTVTGQPSHYQIQNQFPTSGSGFSQSQTVIGHYNQPSKPWMDYYLRFPLQSGGFQRYTGANEQYPSQSGTFQRYPLMNGAAGQYFTANGMIEHNTPQNLGVSQQYSPLGGTNGQFIFRGGINGQLPLQRYPSPSGASEQFFLAGAVNVPYSLLGKVNAKYFQKVRALGQNPPQKLAYERYPPKTGGYLNSRMKENNISEGLMSASSGFKEHPPKSRYVTKIESEEDTERKVIEKGIVAISAPTAAAVEDPKTDMVVQKGLIAIKATSSEVKGDVKNGEAIPNSPTNIKGPDHKASPTVGVEVTETEVVVEKGLIAIEAPSSGEVGGEATQKTPTHIETSDNKPSSAASVDSTKTEMVVEKKPNGIEAIPCEEVENQVKDEENIQVPDNGKTGKGELATPVDVTEFPLSELAVDNTESISGRLAENKEPVHDNLVDAKPISEPKETKAVSDKEKVEIDKFGSEEVDTELTYTASVNTPFEDGRIIGKEYVSKIVQRPGVSEKGVEGTSEINPGQDLVGNPNQSGKESTENISKIETRDTTNVLGESQTISFTIHLPAKTITTKTISEHTMKDGNEINVVPIQRIETVEHKGGLNGHIEPTITNGPNGVHITYGSSGNNGINQQGGDLTHVLNLSSILDLAQAVADGNSKQSVQNKLDLDQITIGSDLESSSRK